MQELFLKSLKKSKEEYYLEAKSNYYSPTNSGYWSEITTLPAAICFIKTACDACGHECYNYEDIYICACDKNFLICWECENPEEYQEKYKETIFATMRAKSDYRASQQRLDRCNIDEDDINMHSFSRKLDANKVSCSICETQDCETIYRCIGHKSLEQKSLEHKNFANHSADDPSNCNGVDDGEIDNVDCDDGDIKQKIKNSNANAIVTSDCDFDICELCLYLSDLLKSFLFSKWLCFIVHEYLLEYQTSTSRFITLLEEKRNKGKENENKNKNYEYTCNVDTKDEMENNLDQIAAKKNPNQITVRKNPNQNADEIQVINYRGHKLIKMPAKISNEEIVRYYKNYYMDGDYQMKLNDIARKYFDITPSGNYRIDIDFNPKTIFATVKLFWIDLQSPPTSEIIRGWILNIIERKIKPLLVDSEELISGKELISGENLIDHKEIKNHIVLENIVLADNGDCKEKRRLTKIVDEIIDEINPSLDEILFSPSSILLTKFKGKLKITHGEIQSGCQIILSLNIKSQ